MPSKEAIAEAKKLYRAAMTQNLTYYNYANPSIWRTAFANYIDEQKGTNTVTNKPTEEIEDWAWEMARQEINEESKRMGWRYPAFSTLGQTKEWKTPSSQALAARIQRNEKPPVDPDLLEARELMAAEYRNQGYPERDVNRVLSGKWDNYTSIQTALAAIKRYKRQ